MATNSIVLDLNFLNEKREERKLTTELCVVTSSMDVIVGLKEIQQARLVMDFPSLFSLDGHLLLKRTTSSGGGDS